MKVNTDGCLLGAWASADAPTTILDVGAGSGLIGLMLAQRYPNATVDLVEIEPHCAEQCAENVLLPVRLTVAVRVVEPATMLEAA